MDATLFPEYEGAVFVDPGAANDGQFETFKETAANNHRQWYKFTSNDATEQEGHIWVTWRAPDDIVAASTVTVDYRYRTGDASTNNKLDILVYKNNAGAASDSDLALVNAAAGGTVGQLSITSVSAGDDLHFEIKFYATNVAPAAAYMSELEINWTV